MNIYAHLKDFNIVILENTCPEVATVRSSLNICNTLKMILLKVIFERCC